MCFYFELKFHNLNVLAKSLIDSKQKFKIKTQKTYLLIKHHNDLCLKLDRFNNFWKYFLVSMMSFYILFIWVIMYCAMIHSLNFLPKIFMRFLLVEIIVIFFSIEFVIFSVSLEVIFKNHCQINKLLYRQNHFIQFSTVFMSN